MRLTILAIAMVALAPPPLRASLWDDETLAAEAKGLPSLVHVITGRFERNPPLYYETRLSRALALIKANPNDLAAYDAAGVACDRLGRGGEAIAWMERKYLQMAMMRQSRIRTPDQLQEHLYRCFANIGTFWAHRWVRAGATRARIDEVRSAHQFIARAVRANPQTYFERERYELRILETILAAPVSKQDGLPPLLDLNDPTNRGDAAVRALTGLIVLGNDANSLDLFNTLAQVLERTDPKSALAALARLRCQDLIDAGQRSVLTGAPSEPEALRLAIDRAPARGAAGVQESDQEVRVLYRRLCDEAEAWHHNRTIFISHRLAQGRDPSTDRTFWNGFQAAAPPLPAFVPPVIRGSGDSLREWAHRVLQKAFFMLVAGSSLCAVLTWLVVRATGVGPITDRRNGHGHGNASTALESVENPAGRPGLVPGASSDSHGAPIPRPGSTAIAIWNTVASPPRIASSAPVANGTLPSQVLPVVCPPVEPQAASRPDAFAPESAIAPVDEAKLMAEGAHALREGTLWSVMELFQDTR